MDPMIAMLVARARYEDLVREAHNPHHAEAVRRRARRRRQRRRAAWEALRRWVVGARRDGPATSAGPEPA